MFSSSSDEKVTKPDRIHFSNIVSIAQQLRGFVTKLGYAVLTSIEVVEHSFRNPEPVPGGTSIKLDFKYVREGLGEDQEEPRKVE